MISAKNNSASPSFKVAWLIITALIVLQLIYTGLCYQLGSELQHNLGLEQRVMFRTAFYTLAIILFPLTSLVRYILCRLNQTMPGNQTAQQRYLTTVIISLLMIEPVGLFGFIMFILGDDFNTLYIFSGLAMLGFFLHRPKSEEYQAIADALAQRI